MGRYDIETETRELEIQRPNVPLLVHAGGGQTAELPPPVGLVKFSAVGEKLGKSIYVTGNLNNAVGSIIQKQTEPGNRWAARSSGATRSAAKSRYCSGTP